MRETERERGRQQWRQRENYVVRRLRVLYFARFYYIKVKEDKIYGPYITNDRNEKNKRVVGRPDGFEDQNFNP